MGKYIKGINENMKLVSKNDLDNWSGKAMSASKRKDIEKKLSNIENSKILKDIKKVLAEYGVGIYSAEKQDFLTTNRIKFPNEKKIEYRLTLGRIVTEKDIEEEYQIYDGDIEAFEKEFPNGNNEEHIAEYKEKLESVGTVDQFHGEQPIFSFFLDEDLPTEIMASFQETVGNLGLMQGAIYLKNLLHCYPHVTEGGMSREEALFATDELKCLFRQFRIKVTNQNLEVYPKAVYRMYKDSKFFSELEAAIGPYPTKSLLKDLDKVIK